jgi:hypothetical protein
MAARAKAAREEEDCDKLRGSRCPKGVPQPR